MRSATHPSGIGSQDDAARLIVLRRDSRCAACARLRTPPHPTGGRSSTSFPLFRLFLDVIGFLALQSDSSQPGYGWRRDIFTRTQISS